MRGFWIVLILLAAPLAGCTLGDFPAGADDITIRSATIASGEAIPRQHTCDGLGTSPPLTFGELPVGTETIAVIVDDPDAADQDPFVHWLVWNVPVSGGSASIPEGSIPSEAVEGANDAGSIGWTGPCPPREDGPHTYDVTASAVDRSLELDEGADRAELEEALRGHVLAEGHLSAVYDR